VQSLVELAETLGARVVSEQTRMNFPTTHALYGGADPVPYLKDADALLIIDQDVPYVPSQVSPRPETKVIHIDIDPVKQDIPIWNFPVDLLMGGDSSKALPVLTEIIQQRITDEQRARAQDRLKKLSGENKELQDKWRNLASSRADQKPIAPEWLCHCLAEVIDKDTIVLDEAVTNSQILKHQLSRIEPGTFFSSGGSSR
jgi:acetolactate synthase-1/2/3 large subunit